MQHCYLTVCLKRGMDFWNIWDEMTIVAYWSLHLLILEKVARGCITLRCIENCYDLCWRWSEFCARFVLGLFYAFIDRTVDWQEMGREMGSDTQQRSSGSGLKPVTHCQPSEPMCYAPGPVGQRNAQCVPMHYVSQCTMCRNAVHRELVDLLFWK